MSQGGKGDWGKEMSSWKSRWRERVYLCVQDNDRGQKSQIVVMMVVMVVMVVMEGGWGGSGNWI